jgi:hypothetical protein
MIHSYRLGVLPHQHEALSIGDDLGRIQGLLEVSNKLLLVSLEAHLLWRCDSFACTDTFVLDSRQASCKHSLTDERDCIMRINRCK